jgi:hypothetical protein
MTSCFLQSFSAGLLPATCAKSIMTEKKEGDRKEQGNSFFLL